MAFELKGKVAVVTGAAGGIGTLVVKNLVKENVKHVALLDIAVAAATSLQDEINAQNGNKTKFYKCDVTKEDQLISALNSITASQGSIDILINNAGIFNDDWKSYRFQIDTNVTGVITGTLRGLELMRQDKGGKGGIILNVASVAALTQLPYIPIYQATKSAVLQFSNCIGMKELHSRTGVHVVAICFGVTDTPLFDNFGCFDKELQSLFPKVLKKLPGQKPESAAAGVIEVLKKAESGSTWLVNGGKPAEDISNTVQKAYAMLSELFYNV